MGIRIYNTLSRRKEDFEPLNPPHVGLYTCGPTVYNYAHIGNLRTFLFQDLLKKHLRFRGYDVKHVMNITDVEDKIIRTCRETGESLKSLTNRYTDAFFEDLATLGIDPPDVCPRATETIDEMVELVKTLRERGHTYESDGSVYFRLKSFPEYGKLSHFDIDTLQEGASGRVQADEYSTEDARDFALWKAYVPDDGEVYWETELGKGRPGWHLECSCMSMQHLGESFDIHCGGVDLIFPHHENEIAQSEAATGKPFVKYWMHAAHLNVAGKKISKSLGNSIVLRDMIAGGHDPLAIRYALRATHYRQPSNFSDETIEAAKESLRRIRDFRIRLGEVMGSGDDFEAACTKCESAFAEALDDDLNVSEALAAVFELIREGNRLMDDDDLSEAGAQRANELLDKLDGVMGLFPRADSGEVPEAITALVNERQQARRDKNFARADEIRDQLANDGWVIEDTPDGARVKRA
jgi:cysteinyl-tRNA synthetase